MMPTRLLYLVIAWLVLQLYFSVASRMEHYRTSDMGQCFLLVIPVTDTSWASDHITAHIDFMTYEFESKVAIMMPRHINHNDTNYDETILDVKNHLQNQSRFILKAINSVSKVGVGNAIKITSSAHIIVTVTLFGRLFDVGMLVLPPTCSYSTDYTVNVPYRGKRVYFIAMAYYDDTSIVKFFDKGGNDVKEVKLVLNSLTYDLSYTSTSSTQLFIGRFSASKPILVLTGAADERSFRVVPRSSDYAKRLVLIATTMERGMLAGKVGAFDETETIEIEALGFDWKRTITPRSSKLVSFPLERECVIIEASHLISLVIYNQKSPNIPTVECLSVPEKYWTSYSVFRKPWDICYGQIELCLILKSRYKTGLLYNGKYNSKFLWQTVKEYDLETNSYEFVLEIIEDEFITIFNEIYGGTFIAYVTIYSDKNEMENYKSRLSTFHLGKTYHYPEDRETHTCLNRSDPLPTPGDDVDDDCDDLYDEELLNGRDDDGDGLVDEDLMSEFIRASWSHWMPWHCECQSIPSSQGQLKRYRACDYSIGQYSSLVCPGLNQDLSEKTCKANCTTFLETCPLKKYGSNCDKDCPEGCAMGLCDRIVGRCDWCKKGFRQSAFCEYRDHYMEHRKPEKKYIVLTTTTPTNTPNTTIAYKPWTSKYTDYSETSFNWDTLKIASSFILMLFLLALIMFREWSEREKSNNSPDALDEDSTTVGSYTTAVSHLFQPPQTDLEVSEND